MKEEKYKRKGEKRKCQIGLVIQSQWKDCAIVDCNVFDEDGEFDFNKIVPQPRSIEECPVKYVIPELERKNSNIEILKDRPWFNWYEWNWDYWGTKWRVHDTHKKDKNNIRFKTAWRPPLKVIKALSKNIQIEWLKFILLAKIMMESIIYSIGMVKF